MRVAITRSVSPEIGASFERTRRRLEGAGIGVVAVDVSEIARAEGALACCSLVFEAAGGAGPAG